MRIGWSSIKKFRELLRETAPAPTEMASRLKAVERDVILPVKAVLIGILLFSLYRSRWFEDPSVMPSIAHAVFERFFLIYLALNVGMALFLIFYRPLPSVFAQRLIFTSSFLDGLFLAALCFVTGGFNSSLYWLFLGLIVRNAFSIPLMGTQLILNFSLSLCYLLAGLADVTIESDFLDEAGEANYTEPFLLRLFVLWLLTMCVWGVQVLVERHRQVRDEAREFSARQKELHSAGRLAAQIAHQLKNPLGIINNAAFTLNRALKDGPDGAPQQVRIIREEVERADRIITKLMGYSQLAEGKVERLNLVESIERAVRDVFPVGSNYGVTVEKVFADRIPKVLMQRGHLSEILVNLLANARDAFGGKPGKIVIRVGLRAEKTIVIEIEDNGPGIPPELLAKVFQAYFTTKEKGTGLGLAIVKHNTEMYGGTVGVDSVLGKGTRFVVTLPTRTVMRQRT
jgi:signal transduction histidine kinase